MKKDEVRKKINEIGIVASVREHSKEDALFAAESVFEGGISIVEISLIVPSAIEVISQLVKQHPKMVVGAGSV
jgi:2-dehydro-3-deoxyphosphogluconate aldolase/(4S)-4-hydroxy-2-oxoglutarate aldolase